MNLIGRDEFSIFKKNTTSERISLCIFVQEYLRYNLILFPSGSELSAFLFFVLIHVKFIRKVSHISVGYLYPCCPGQHLLKLLLRDFFPFNFLNSFELILLVDNFLNTVLIEAQVDGMRVLPAFSMVTCEYHSCLFLQDLLYFLRYNRLEPVHIMLVPPSEPPKCKLF